MDNLLTMKTIITAVLLYFQALCVNNASAAVGPLINGNQINPRTAISISTLTVTGAAGVAVTSAPVTFSGNIANVVKLTEYDMTITGKTNGSTNPTLTMADSGSGITRLTNNGGILLRSKTSPNTGGIYLGGQGAVTGNVGLGQSDDIFTPTTALSVWGVITSSTAIPSVACNAGTGTLSATSTDQHGTITTGAASVNCTVTFSVAWPKTPVCIVGEGSTLALVRVSAVSTTAFTVAGTALNGDVLYYMCMGAP